MRITVFYDHVREACRQAGKSLREIAGIVTEHGISGVEMDYQDIRKHGGRLAKQLREAGIPIHCVYCFFDWGNQPQDKSYRKILRQLSRYGVEHVLVIPGFVADGQDREVYRECMAVVLQDMCRYAGKKHIHVHMEDFDDKAAVFATGAEVKWFMDRVPELTCTFDTGNFLYSDEKAEEVLPLLLERIGYVHCKDRSFEVKEGEEPKLTVSGKAMYSAAVGSGVIPMAELVDRIKESGYDGAYAIEHFGSQNQLKDMVASADWLRKRLSQA